jgi:hypothetical protein
MRRYLLVLLIVTACGRESRAPEPQPARTPPSTDSRSVVVPPPKPRIVVSAARCAGDGGYAAALDCFRVTAGYHFAIVDGSARAEGDMARRMPGAEDVRFHLSGEGGSDGDWVGISKQSGIVWYRSGKKMNSEPAVVDDLYQRTTLVFDPQKREGEPKLEGVETIDGIECNRYRFTDANSGEVHEVWVSKSGGDLVKTKSAVSAQFRSVRRDFTMTLSRQGQRPAIEDPK